MNRMKEWGSRNVVAIFLVILFSVIFFISQSVEDSLIYLGVTGLQYLNREYYRFLTCLFLHYSFGHLLVNSLAMLSISSILSPYVRKTQIVFLFLSGGVLSEIAYSIVISERIYDIGASSGIFALIACLLVCYLRFRDPFRKVWYRPDGIMVLVYFVFANTSIRAFLVHTFGFAAGILISFFMVSAGWIKTFRF